MTTSTVRARLEELRIELRAERISYGELAELQGLAEHIEPGDVELLEAAGVPEFNEEARDDESASAPTLNYYGLPITPPEHFDGAHVANPGPAGLPPVCSCGWTRWRAESGTWFEMSDHLADMKEGSDAT